MDMYICYAFSIYQLIQKYLVLEELTKASLHLLFIDGTNTKFKTKAAVLILSIRDLIKFWKRNDVHHYSIPNQHYRKWMKQRLRTFRMQINLIINEIIGFSLN